MNLEWKKEMLEGFKSISKIDLNFQEIINQFGIPNNRGMPEGFKSLIKIIIGQQISTVAAKSIWNKLEDNNILVLNTLLKTTECTLKSYGLSKQKSNYIKNIAFLISTKELNLKNLVEMDSDKIFELLIKIKGIGKWTINNYQVFVLQNLDAWPSGDLALREAVKSIKGLKEKPNEKKMEQISSNWIPYRGAAALLLWHYYKHLKSNK